MITTCYGPAYWRILGALVAIHGDDKGLVLPPAIAPYQVVIIPIYYSEKEKKDVMKFAESLCKNLTKKFRTFFDTDEQHSPGWKFNFWEMKGVPLRIEIGPKDVKGKQAVVVRRDDRSKNSVKQTKITKLVEDSLESIQDDLKAKAEKFFNDYLSEAGSFDKLKKILDERGGLVKTSWCGEKVCADNIKEKTGGGTIRGTLFAKKVKPKGSCVMCGKTAGQIAYIAKQY